MATAPDFEIAYQGATEEQRNIVTKHIQNGDKNAVQQWLALQVRNNLVIEELPVKELRRLASSLGIAGYQYLTKSSLLSQIRSRG